MHHVHGHYGQIPAVQFVYVPPQVEEMNVCVWRDAHCMVKGDSVDDHELAEVILVGIVIPMPGHHIKRGVALQKENWRSNSIH